MHPGGTKLLYAWLRSSCKLLGRFEGVASDLLACRVLTGKLHSLRGDTAFTLGMPAAAKSDNAELSGGNLESGGLHEATVFIWMAAVEGD